MGVSGAFLLPQLWLLSISLKTRAGVYEFPPRLVSPHSSLANYGFVFAHTQVPWYLWNSARVAALATLVTVLLGIPAAYALSRERFPHRDRVLTGLLLAQMVSPIVLLVPLYGLVARLGLLDYPRRPRARLRCDAAALHHRRPQELLRCAAAFDVRGCLA